MHAQKRILNESDVRIVLPAFLIRVVSFHFLVVDIKACLHKATNIKSRKARYNPYVLLNCRNFLKSNCRLTSPRIGKFVAETVVCVKLIRGIV